jgi:hypothetical protein
VDTPDTPPGHPLTRPSQLSSKPASKGPTMTSPSTATTTAPPSTTFGDWTFDRERFVLKLSNGYEFELGYCSNPATTWDYLLRAQRKRFVTAQRTGDLVAAMDALLCFDPTWGDPNPNVTRGSILESERRVLAQRLAAPREHEARDLPTLGSWSSLNLGELARIEAECRDEVDAMFGGVTP